MDQMNLILFISFLVGAAATACALKNLGVRLGEAHALSVAIITFVGGAAAVFVMMVTMVIIGSGKAG